MRTKKAAIRMATVLAGALMLFTLGGPSQGSCHSQPVTPPLNHSPPQAMQKFRLPLTFEEVKGPSGQVNFLARGPGYELLLTPQEAVFIYPEKKPPRPDRFRNRGNPGEIPARMVSMKFLGAKAAPHLVPQDKMKGYRNYYVGKRPETWRTKVPLYRRVKYEGIYPGIDLVYYEKGGRLEYDFVVAPGADPSKIQLAFEGVDRLSVDPEGNLVFQTPEKRIVQRAPLVYQEIGGQKKEVPGRCVLKGKNRVAFALGGYDRSKPLIIDPAIYFLTYLGGGTYDHPVESEASNDYATGVAVDGDGNIYVTGTQWSYTRDFLPGGVSEGYFPRTKVLYGLFNEPGAFITKFSPRGVVLWSLIVSGGESEFGHGIAVDTSGNAYATGYTSSPELPIMGGYQDFLNPTYPDFSNVPTDAFLVKVDSDGTLLYSTYLGGGDIDEGSAIAVDNSGNAYVTGVTLSYDFPTKNALFLDTDEPGTRSWDRRDAFVSKVDTTATGEDSLVFSTYLGGTRDDYGTGIAVDGSGNIYVAGETRSGDFPLVNEFPSPPGGCASVFLSKLNSAGSVLLYSTFLGSSDRRDGQGVHVAADDAGNAYLSGTAYTADFPLRNAFRTTFESDEAFVTRINTNLAGDDSLIYSTFLGGIRCDFGGGIAVDNPERVYVTGATMSMDFPLVNSPATRLVGGYDIFIASLNTQETGEASLTYSACVAGGLGDYGCDVAIDGSFVNVVGYTASANLPTTPGIFQEDHSNPGFYDCFVLRLVEWDGTIVDITAPPSIHYYSEGNFSSVGQRPQDCKPIGWSNTTKGRLSMQVALPKFQGPVNLYLALFDGKDIDPNNLPDIFQINDLYLIGPEGEVHPVGQKWTPWMGNQSNFVDRLLSVDISPVDLAGGYCYVALIAQPLLVDPFQIETTLIGHYTWVTRFPVPQNQQEEVLQSLKSLNGGSREVKLAIQALEKSLSPEYWFDAWTPSYLGKKIFDLHQIAVHELMKGKSTQKAVKPAIDNIVKMDQTLAVNAVVDAVAKRGAPNHLQQARKDMEKAQQLLKVQKMDQAIIFFGSAWAKAEEALRMAKTK